MMPIEYSKLRFSRRAPLICCAVASFFLISPHAISSLNAKPQNAKTSHAKKNEIAHQTVSAAQLLAQMADAERGANYSATETIERADSAPISLRVSRAGRKRFLQYLAPSIRRGDVLVDDGQKTWLYHRAENAVIQTNSAAPRVGPNRATNARVVGETRLGGRAAWLLEVRRDGKVSNLKSSTRNVAARRIWIDKQTHLRLATQIFSPDGQSLEHASLSNVKIGGVGDARFRWNPPRGAQVVRTSGTLFSQFSGAQRAASWLQFPRYVPRDFNFESAIVDNVKGEAWLRYASSSRRFSIFQQKIGGAQKMNAAPQKVDGGWYRASGGSRLLIVGAEDGVAQKILQSVR